MSPRSKSQPRSSPNPAAAPTEREGAARTPDPETERERLVVQYLSGREGPARMRTVARSVAAAESETPVAALSTAQYQRVYVALYRTLLPRLDRVGLIEYERTRGLVYPTARLERTVPAATASATPPETVIGTEPSDGGNERAAVLGLAGLVLSAAALYLSPTVAALIGGLVIVAFLYRVIVAPWAP